QATSQALQPMQVVVSMYFETVGMLRRPERLPRTEAEERRISRFCTLMAASSNLLDFDLERLVLGRPDVWFEHRGSQEVGEWPDAHPREAPVDGEADLPDVFSVHVQRSEAPGHERLALDRAAGARDLDHLLVGDPLLFGHRLRDLEEEVLLDHVQLVV